MSDKKQVRSIFLSDVHLGSKFSAAAECNEFLKGYDPEYLYLVGDIVDGWKLKGGVYWPDCHNEFLRRILKFSKRGTKIRYLVGNHDEFLRFMIGDKMGGIAFEEEFVHECLDGTRLLVTHGDIFDKLTRHATWLYHVGDGAYTAALWANRALNDVRRRAGLSYYPLSSVLKQKVKQAANFINGFEHLLVRQAVEKNCQGVVCGHIHACADKWIDGIRYLNCGDWVESRTAIVESTEGVFSLVD